MLKNLIMWTTSVYQKHHKVRVKKKIYIMKKQFYLNYITFINKFKICNPIETKVYILIGVS